MWCWRSQVSFTSFLGNILVILVATIMEAKNKPIPNIEYETANRISGNDELIAPMVYCRNCWMLLEHLLALSLIGNNGIWKKTLVRGDYGKSNTLSLQWLWIQSPCSFFAISFPFSIKPSQTLHLVENRAFKDSSSQTWIFLKTLCL